jgi:hypothetical protein
MSAENSLNSTQGAEAIGRDAGGDPVEARDGALRSRPILGPELPDGERRTSERLLDQAEDAPNGHQLLRQLACWYREFAERTRSPIIWDARLLLAESLDEEAERIERLNEPR